MRLLPGPRTPAIFAVASDAVQVTFGRHVERIAVAGPGCNERVDVDRSAGSITVRGLQPSSTYRIEVVGAGGTRSLTATTLARPPGAELLRVATMNDLHLGQDAFGLSGLIRHEGSARRCAEEALAAAAAWGADRIVLKGDLTHKALDHEFEQLRALVEASPVAVDLMLGNHESAEGRAGRSRAWLCRQPGFVDDQLRRVTSDGLDLLLADTTVPDRHDGSIHGFATDLVDALHTSGPALVLHHHQMGPSPFYTYPKGIHGQRVRELLRTVAGVNPNTVFASGHTHRHRRFTHETLTVTELGSTKDYPGTWCGYTVYEGGIEATVYRLADADTVAWLDRTGAAVWGVWARWSPGHIGDRCWSQRWV